MTRALLEARLEWVLAQAKRDHPRRRALLWSSPHAHPDRVYLYDRRPVGVPAVGDAAVVRIDDLADAPVDAILVVLHPALRVALLRDYLTRLPVSAAEAERLIAEAYVRLAIEIEPPLRAALDW